MIGKTSIRITCYDVSSVNFIEAIDIPPVLVVLAIVLQIVITYQIPAPRGAFFHDGILLICKLPTQQRVLVAGDLNLAHVVWGC